MTNADDYCDGSRYYNGDDDRFEIWNDCKFQRSDVELYLAQVYFGAEQSARIQINCVKAGLRVYNKSYTTKNTMYLKLNSAKVNVDLNGANCSFTGCYDSDAFGAVYTIPDKSCVIDFDECLPEYCPVNVSTCDAVTAPRGTYTCTCNQMHREFNYTTNECNCISGYQESENGTYCELPNIDVTAEIESTMYQNLTSPDLDARINASSISAAVGIPVAIGLFIIVMIILLLLLYYKAVQRRRERLRAINHWPVHAWDASYDDNLSLDVKKPAISQWGSVRTLDRDLCPLEHNSSPNEHTNGSAEYKPDVNHLTSENSSTCIASSLMGGGNCKYLSAEQSWSRELQFQGAASIPHQCHSDTQVTRTFSHNLDLVWDTSYDDNLSLDVNKPAIPQSGGSLHKFDLCSLEYNDCDPDEHTSTFNSSAEFKPDVSDLTSENSSKCKASRVMDEGNSEHLDAESPLKVRQEPKLVTSELYLPGGAFSMENSRIPSLSSCRQSNSELQEAKFAEQSQNRELQLQGAANFPQPVIQHHGNAQEMRSSSLNLDLTNSKSDLDTDLPVVTEYNEESGQAHRPCHDVDGYIF